jgi:transcriptional regulator with XRE-family HTH domain
VPEPAPTVSRTAALSFTFDPEALKARRKAEGLSQEKLLRRIWARADEYPEDTPPRVAGRTLCVATLSRAERRMSVSLTTAKIIAAALGEDDVMVLAAA